MTLKPPCVLAYGGDWPDGSVYQCARCMAKRHFWRGRSVIRSVHCDGAGVVDEGVEIERWRRLGDKK